jgi:rod shape-determining protein MreB
LPAAERLRIEIGSASAADVDRHEDVNGVDVVSGLPRRVRLSSTQVREALCEPLARILDAMKRTLEGCTPDLVGDLVDQGVTLAGGGALLRGLDRMIVDELGLPARVAKQPLTTVARGTLFCLEHFDRWRPTLECSDDEV